MDCPFCGAVVMHAQWLTPFAPASAGGQTEKVKRDVIQAAYWASVNAGKPLADYLKTNEGQPFANYWSAADVQHADRHVVNNPLLP